MWSGNIASVMKKFFEVIHASWTYITIYRYDVK